ncbi:hypothetical protein GCM10007905_39250 [Mixta theicola]|nr:hypothetical protein GCM10007905_39250 [Mixta theicola]
MLNNTEASAALQKAEAGSNTPVGQINHAIMDEITHHGENRENGKNLVKPGANRRIRE